MWTDFLKNKECFLRNVFFSAEYVKAYNEYMRCTERPESMLGFKVAFCYHGTYN